MAQVCPPEIQWQRSFGGVGEDNVYPSKPLMLPDGGFLLPGASRSEPSGNKTTPAYGYEDFWLIRTDAHGNEIWQRSYGGSSLDFFPLVTMMRDGSILVAGTSDSAPDGNKTAPSTGAPDVWLLKLDLNGDVVWQRSLGITNFGWLLTMRPTANGGFVLGGMVEASSRGLPVPGGYGGMDAWVGYLDADANLVWQRYFGGAGDEFLRDIREMPNGDFVFVADSDSPAGGNKLAPAFGGVDAWIVRLDHAGNKIWEQTFGGDNYDYPTTLAVRPDGGVFVGINTASGISGNKTVPERGLHGFFDIWLISLDASGRKLWDQSYGGTLSDAAGDLLLMPDGGLMIAAWSDSDDGDRTSPAFGFDDWWLLRVDGYGRKLYELSLGGSGFDNGIALTRGADDGFLCFGHSNSPQDGNKITPNYGGDDYWVVKLGPEEYCDTDNDGVPDMFDSCPSTPAGSVGNRSGCSIEQLVPCSANWRNHGEYVSAISKVVAEFFKSGLISDPQRQSILERAAHSDCGKSDSHHR